jgi:ABC-type transporter Mla subunit MlaD
MAILPVERSMCNKMVYDFNGLLAPAQQAKGAVKSKKNEMQSLLNTLTSSSQSAINNAISGLTSQVDDIIPTATLYDMQQLQRFIEQCEYLSALSPIAAMLGALNSIYNKIDDFLDNIGAAVPEFNIGKLASAINDLLSSRGPNISDLLKNLDKLLNCVELYCGGEYPAQLSSMTTALGQAYSDLNITSNPLDSNYGLFDFNSMYSVAGLDATQIAQQDQVRNAVDGEKNRAKSTIDSAINIFKENLL